MRGFTLIELMIVIVVISILMAIAIPNYSAYVMRSHRAYAKAALLKASQWMERTATATGSYTDTLAAGLEVVEGGRYTVCLVGGTLAPGVGPLPLPGCPATVAGLTATPAPPDWSATQFTLVAYRIKDGANYKDKCGDFILTHTGVRMIGTIPPATAPTLTTTECWGR